MNITENAKTVLEKRYLTRDPKNKVVETVEGLFHRVAHAIASADLAYDSKADVKSLEALFYKTMTDLDFLPNSPTLMNAGKPLGQLSACFVLPVPDSMEGIFDAIKNAALIHKSGGGTGFSFSRLRSTGSTVKSTGGVASGPISFMKVFNAATEAVKQGGTRRGANMGILRVDHPDILQFINCKSDTGEITNFNISIAITEKFMEAVKAGSDYDLIDPLTKKSVGKLNAKTVYDTIVKAAWSTGEPGIIFLDRINRYNVVPSKGEIESTNPCGEQPLLPYESCNLGSINLSNMLKEGKKGPEIDYDKLERTIEIGVHFLDNVIDINKYPLEIIDETTRATRKIGLGIMGFADMLLKLGIPYNSKRCIELAGSLMKFIDDKGKEKSRELAKIRGAFPLFEESIFKDSEKIRNATVTTIAPTGTLSIIAGCSSGIEPNFAYVYIRNVMDNTEMIEVNPILKAELEKRGLYTDKLMKKIASAGTLAHIQEIPKDIKEVFVASHDVSPEYHIKVQAAFQNYTDNAVSKTVNFSNEATIGDVDKVYMLAYELGCKGVTIYRDGSRQMQVLNIGKVKKTDSETKNIVSVMENPEHRSIAIKPRPRPDVVKGFTEKVQIGCGNLYVTVNFDDKGIVEVFTNTGKAGGCPSQSESTARLVSVSLRSGIDVQTIINQLKGIRCPSTIRQPGMKVTSCPDAIAKVIEKVVQIQKETYGDVTPQTVEISEVKPIQSPPQQQASCPECGKPLEHSGGCVTCRNCGYSKCG